MTLRLVMTCLLLILVYIYNSLGLECDDDGALYVYVLDVRVETELGPSRVL